MSKGISISFGLLLALTIFLSFYRLGSVSLFDVDEAVFAEATKEMVQSGNWITPTYNGTNRYDKPILFYWTMAASYKVFGINEFGARFPSALSGLALSVSLFLFMRRFAGEKAALYSLAAFALSPYYFMYSHAAVTDMLLAFFISASLFSFFFWDTSPPQRHGGQRRFIYGFYLFSALAFLTKGLIGIVFPFGVAAGYLIASGRKGHLIDLFDLRGIMLFLVAAGPWYGAEYAANGNEFLRQFFLKHHFMRYTDANSGHTGPVYYYLPALIAGLFPWIAFLPSGLRRQHGAGDDMKPLRLFASVWLFLIVVFFSFSTTKLPNYILPAIPAATILIGSGMAGRKRPGRIAVSFVLFTAAALGAGFLLSRNYLPKAGITELDWTIWAAGIMFLLSASGIYGLLSGKKFYVPAGALMACFLLLVSIKILPVVSREIQGKMYDFSISAGQKLPPDGRVVVYGMNYPSIAFYSGREVKNAETPEQMKTFIEKTASMVVLAKVRDIDILESLGLKLTGRNEKFAYFERK